MKWKGEREKICFHENWNTYYNTLEIIGKHNCKTVCWSQKLVLFECEQSTRWIVVSATAQQDSPSSHLYTINPSSKTKNYHSSQLTHSQKKFCVCYHYAVLSSWYGRAHTTFYPNPTNRGWWNMGMHIILHKNEAKVVSGLCESKSVDNRSTIRNSQA